MGQKVERDLPLFPERVGRYPLVAPIASGGLATVYLGKLLGIGGFERSVAVKLLHPHLREERELVQHFITEAKLASGIHHPNVVQVLDVGEDPNGIYLVMEYVESETLAVLMKAAARAGEGIPARIALRISVDALRGLHAAHEATDAEGQPLELIHRDFSPQNILVGTDGTSRLIDFGVAKVARSGIHTRTGTVKGKVAYMSPEQARGRELDRRCDVWAAGVVIWELFAGQRLFKTDDEVATMMRVISDPVPPLGEIAPGAPIGVQRATSAALCRELELRAATAFELEQTLVSGCEDDIASAEEVAKYVRLVAATPLAERARRIDHVRALRGETEPTQPAVTAKSLPEARTEGRRRGIAVALFALALGGIGVATLTRPRWTGVLPLAAPASAPPSANLPTRVRDSVVVVADAPMRSLSVAGHAVELLEATERVQVPKAEDGGSFTLKATSTDGRTTSYVARAEETEIHLRFGEPRSVETSRPATQKSKPTQRTVPRPLSPSPYSK